MQWLRINLPVQETQIQSLGQEDSTGEGNGNLLQYSCLENSLRQRSLAGTVCGITESWMWVSSHACICAIELYSSKWDLNSVQLSSLDQSCPTLCDPMDCSTPGLPVHHQLLESTQTHVHRVGDAIQPSRHLSSPSPPALNLSQHQGLFKWVSSLHQVVKVLEFQLQHQSYQWTPRTDFL